MSCVANVGVSSAAASAASPSELASVRAGRGVAMGGRTDVPAVSSDVRANANAGDGSRKVHTLSALSVVHCRCASFSNTVRDLMVIVPYSKSWHMPGLAS